MLNARRTAAAKVAENLTPAEADMDNALSSLMALSVTMMNALDTANLSRVVGQQAFDSLGEAMALMFQARSKLIETHQRLDAVKDSIGLRTVAFGTWQDKPKLNTDEIQSAADADSKVIPIAA